MRRAACGRCGAQDGARHNRSCAVRRTAASAGHKRTQPSATLLRTTARLTDAMLLGTDKEAATYLVYAGLGGRYAYVTGRGWLHYTGKGWRPTKVENVRAAVRATLGAAYDRHTGADDARRLLDVNWALKLVGGAVRQVATVDASEVGL